MKVLICIFFLLIPYHTTTAQTTSSPANNDKFVEIRRSGNRYEYWQNGTRLLSNQVGAAISTNPGAHKKYENARALKSTATALSVIGGGFMGYTLYNVFAKRRLNGITALAGTGCLLVAIPLSSHTNRQAIKAVNEYNSSLEKTAAYHHSTEVYIGMTGNGIGLTVKF